MWWWSPPGVDVLADDRAVFVAGQPNSARVRTCREGLCQHIRRFEPAVLAVLFRSCCRHRQHRVVVCSKLAKLGGGAVRTGCNDELELVLLKEW